MLNIHVSAPYVTVFFTIELYICNLFFFSICLFHSTLFSIAITITFPVSFLSIFTHKYSNSSQPPLMQTFWSSNIINLWYLRKEIAHFYKRSLGFVLGILLPRTKSKRTIKLPQQYEILKIKYRNCKWYDQILRKETDNIERNAIEWGSWGPNRRMWQTQNNADWKVGKW